MAGVAVAVAARVVAAVARVRRWAPVHLVPLHGRRQMFPGRRHTLPDPRLNPDLRFLKSVDPALGRRQRRHLDHRWACPDRPRLPTGRLHDHRLRKSLTCRPIGPVWETSIGPPFRRRVSQPDQRPVVSGQEVAVIGQRLVEIDQELVVIGRGLVATDRALVEIGQATAAIDRSSVVEIVLVVATARSSAAATTSSIVPAATSTSATSTIAPAVTTSSTSTIAPAGVSETAEARATGTGPTTGTITASTIITTAGITVAGAATGVTPGTFRWWLARRPGG